MKKTVLLLLAGSILLLSSCETTREISINQDGSGTLVTTNDMSGLVGLAKMSGEGKDEMKQLEEKAVDTTIAFASLVDSLNDLSTEQKDMLRSATLGFVMDIKNEKFVTKMNFPFSESSKINILDKMSGKLLENALKKKMMDSSANKLPPELGSNAMPQTSVDDYYTITYSRGLITRKLDETKYGRVKDDEGMKALEQMSAMGVGNSTLIYNLPSPVKKTEGKNISVSEDKLKVTISNEVGEFFKDGKTLEFRIEY